MKKIFLLTSGLVALGAAAPALAADLPARAYTKAPPMAAAAYDWSGFYIGANGGGGWSHKCWDSTNDGLVDIVPPAREGCHDATGGTVGGQIGYRWQTAAFVFGLEAQGNWADLSGSNASQFFLGDRNRSRIDSFGLFTGQIGYAWNNALLYLKGGAAVTHDKYDVFDIPSGALIDSATKTAGAVWSESEPSTASRRTGRLRWNTTICSWAPQHQLQHAGRRVRWLRQHQAGCRPRYRTDQLPIRGSGRREVLLTRSSVNPDRKPRPAGVFSCCRWQWFPLSRAVWNTHVWTMDATVDNGAD